ncbi:MAG: sulfatase [Planctomycetota bacterium]|jgi:arylsulfatase A-like enzyme|nr:sulfatase [Planctomycetota bacterium]MDP6761684.1 sulfatase [Planctomycetota bacterium]MDP6990998.1 sulfatase [Planctomycetota bacterium]
MKRIRFGFLGGLAAGSVAAALDAAKLVWDVGLFWLDAPAVLASLAAALALGGAVGAAAAATWALFARPPADTDLGTLEGWTAGLSAAGLMGLGAFHLYDLGLPSHERTEPLAYWPLLIVGGVAAEAAWVFLIGIKALLGERAGAAALAFVAFVGGAPLAASCLDIGGGGDAGDDPRPNLMLFVLDTLRRDAISHYGGGRSTTPNLDRIAREGVVYTNAIAAGSWTLPTHGSMFTGLYPTHHGTHSHQVLLHASGPTLAEALSGAGYQTLYVASKAAIPPSKGFGRGFDRAVALELESKTDTWLERLAQHFLGKGPPQAREITDLALRWLESRDESRPSFLFVNVNEPHVPYIRREPWVADCAENIAAEGLDRHKVERAAALKEGLKRHNAGEAPFTEEELTYLACLYYGECMYQDELIGSFFDDLRDASGERGLVALVTSDHGELLGENGIVEHPPYLDAGLIHIPCILWGTGESGTVDGMISQVDFYPLLLSHAGVPYDGSSIDGVFPLPADPDRMVFAETFHVGVAKKAVVTRAQQFLWDSEGAEHLIDRDGAPATARRKTAAAFLDELRGRFDLTDRGVGAGDVEADTLQDLRAIGYVE